jgi:hypothetical protein
LIVVRSVGVSMPFRGWGIGFWAAAVAVVIAVLL